MSSSSPLRRASIAVLLFGAGCVQEQGCGTPPPDCLPPAALPEHTLALDRVVAAFVDDGVRVRGFPGAAPASAAVLISLDSETIEVAADTHGSFEGLVPATPRAVDAGPLPEALVSLSVAGEAEATVRVRDAEAALKCAVLPSLPAGTTSNDLAIARCGGAPIALAVSSAEAAIATASLVGGPAPAPVSFPLDASGRGANPYHLALDEDGQRAAVSLFGQHAAALFEPCSGEVLDVAGPALPDGSALLIDVVPPVELAAPLDADGDGAPETTVGRMLPRHPQGVALVGDRLLVSYTNILEFGAAPRAGPGLVLAFDIDDGALVPAGHVLLPFDNPQGIALDAEGRPWVSCTSQLAPGPFGFEALGDGGLVRLDPGSLEVEEVISLGRFAPGTPAFDDDHIVVGSLVRPEIAVLPRGATALGEGVVLALHEGEVTESLFEAASLGRGLFLVIEHSTDRFHVVDATAAEVDPWPFEGGVLAGPGGLGFRGAQALAVDAAFTWGTDAPDAALLLGQSGEIVPLQLWQVLGP